VKPDVPIYAIVDHRQDGRPRIVAEYVDPDLAAAAADLLRAAGADVRIALISSIVTPT
jgi:hypothetical protein